MRGNSLDRKLNNSAKILSSGELRFYYNLTPNPPKR